MRKAEDGIDWTLTAAAFRAGFRDLAEALTNERLARKSRSAINRNFLARLQRQHCE